MLGQLRSIEVLGSGTTGTTWLVETGTDRFVVKRFASDSLALLGPKAQFELLEALAETGIAPRPVGFDSEARLLVTEFFGAGAPVEAESLQRGETLGALATALRVLHGIDADVACFDPLADVGRYVSAAGGPAGLQRRDRWYLDELRELAASLESVESVLCHNDLVASNLLLDNGLKLIDFDYAVLAPATIDLASAVEMNKLPDDKASQLLDAYFEGAHPPSGAEFARVRRLVRLTAHFWALASTAAEAAVEAGADIVGQYRIKHD